jgi:hypothetical protein
MAWTNWGNCEKRLATEMHAPQPVAKLRTKLSGIAESLIFVDLITEPWQARRWGRRKPVRLHYIERGQGEPLVLLHGNGSMIQDFSSSGLLDKAARKYRVIVFDRPGFGYSRSPRLTVWTPNAQADLIC